MYREPYVWGPCQFRASVGTGSSLAGTEILQLLNQPSPFATQRGEGQQTKGQGLRVLASKHHP